MYNHSNPIVVHPMAFLFTNPRIIYYLTAFTGLGSLSSLVSIIPNEPKSQARSFLGITPKHHEIHEYHAPILRILFFFEN